MERKYWQIQCLKSVWGKSKAELAAVCFFINVNVSMAGYPRKNYVFIGKIKKDTFSYHHPIKGCCSFIYYSLETWKLVCKIQSGCNRVFNMVQGINYCPDFSSIYGCWIRQSHGNSCVWWKYCSTSHRIPILWIIWVNRNVLMVPVSIDKQMNLCSLSSCALDPAQSSVVWHTMVVAQNMKVLSKCLKSQDWNQLKTAWWRGQKFE